MGPGSMVASEIPLSISSCVRSFLRSTISVCTTEIRAINPPNAVLPIRRKLKNRNHRGGPFILKKGKSFSFCLRLISLWTACPQSFQSQAKDRFFNPGHQTCVPCHLPPSVLLVECVLRYSAALILGRFQIAKPLGQIDECLRPRLSETGNSYLLQDGRTAFGRFERYERGTKLLDPGRRKLWRRNQRHVGDFRAARNHAASVLLPGTTGGRKRGDDADIEEATFHRPTDCSLIIHAAYPLIGHGDLVVAHHCVRDPPHICVAIRDCGSASFAACFWAKALALTASASQRVPQRENSKIVLNMVLFIFPPVIRVPRQRRCRKSSRSCTATLQEQRIVLAILESTNPKR